MDFEFDDSELEGLLFDPSHKSRYPVEVVKMYRKRMQFIRNAPDERSLRAMKSFHFEELKGNRKGQHSIRLNQQFRLVFRIVGEKDNKKLVLLAIEDYH